MADNDNHQRLTESLLLCTSWPNTPSRARLRRARELYALSRDPAEKGESFHFSTCVENAGFGEWASRYFRALKEMAPGAMTYNLLVEAAAMGNSDDTIGLAVSGGSSELGQPLFGRLHRDPQWMGLEPLLETIKGLEARVYPHQGYQDRPEVVVAAPPGSPGYPGDPEPFPPGTASTLKKLLESHAATPIWVPSDRDGGSGEELHHHIRLTGVRLYESRNWPRTPSLESWLRARFEVDEMIRAGIPAGVNLKPEHGADLKMTDAWHVLAEEMRATYRRQGLEEASKSIREMKTPRDIEDVVDVLQDIARSGDTPMTVGITVFRDDPSGEHTHALAFSLLSRDPDWMGLDGILPKLTGMVALVYDSVQGSRLPGLVVVRPEPVFAHGTLVHSPFPEGQATWLKEVLEFHGAMPYWLGDTAPPDTASGTSMDNLSGDQTT